MCPTLGSHTEHTRCCQGYRASRTHAQPDADASNSFIYDDDSDSARHSHRVNGASITIYRLVVNELSSVDEPKIRIVRNRVGTIEFEASETAQNTIDIIASG